MPTIAQQFLAPRDCKTQADVLSLNESVVITGKHWLLVQHDGAAVICEQSHGVTAGPTVTIPRRDFQKMLAWYEAEQKRESHP